MPASFDPSAAGTLPPPPEIIMLDHLIIDNIRRIGFTADPPQVFQSADSDGDLTVRVVRRHVGATGDMEWVDVCDPAYSRKEFAAIAAGLVCDGELTRPEADALIAEATTLIAAPKVRA